MVTPGAKELIVQYLKCGLIIRAFNPSDTVVSFRRFIERLGLVVIVLEVQRGERQGEKAIGEVGVKGRRGGR